MSRVWWEDVVDRTLAAVRPYASPGHALVRLPGPASRAGAWSDGLEGFARTLLAAGFRLVHAAPEVADPLADWYARGIATGVDPASDERWPGVNEIPQARVEAASIALALFESRSVLWPRLSDRTRAQLVEWLAPVVGQEYPACNWVWFRAVVEAFLRWAGGPWSTVDTDETVSLTESWYAGDGWYSDGPHAAFDWYCGWAMNVFPLWYCRMSPPEEVAGLAGRYRERLRAYLAGAQHLYAPDGAPLFQGRSLTYRFATVAPLWAGALFDAGTLPPGRTRAIADAVLGYFERHGAWDADGLLSLGWHGAFPPIRQAYSGPGSPYWAGLGFAGLVLPPDHPVWTSPSAGPDGDAAVTLPGPGWLVSRTAADGVVRVVNHGTDGAAGSTVDDPQYTRHGYSTHAGPDPAGGYDGQVALIDPAGAVVVRRPLQRVSIVDHVAVSRFPAGDGWATTASVLRGAVEVRLCRVEGSGPWTLRIGGYCLASASLQVEPGRVRIGSGLVSTVEGLRGFDRVTVVFSEGSNAFGRYAATPVAIRDAPVVPGEICAAAVVLGTGPYTLPVVSVAGARVTVRWSSGEVDEVDLSGSTGAAGPTPP